jgi:hypothetical protein
MVEVMMVEHVPGAAARLRIDVSRRGRALTAAQREDVRRRLLLAMSRFEGQVRGVGARLSEAQNPLGGTDQRCRVRARLQSGIVLDAEAIDGLVEAAVVRSATRLALLVTAALDEGVQRPHFTPASRR